ncbi:hypothetical protein HDU76_004977, partial [Blyttiomyces sp. JEL0837]
MSARSSEWCLVDDNLNVIPRVVGGRGRIALINAEKFTSSGYRGGTAQLYFTLSDGSRALVASDWGEYAEEGDTVHQAVFPLGLTDVCVVNTSSNLLIVAAGKRANSKIPTSETATLLGIARSALFKAGIKVPLHRAVWLSRLPTTSSGKISFSQLESDVEHHFKSSAASIHCGVLDPGSMPFKVSVMVADVLGRENLRGRDFKLVGGANMDSMAAEALVECIREEYGVLLSPMQLLSPLITPSVLTMMIMEARKQKTNTQQKRKAEDDGVNNGSEGLESSEMPREISTTPGFQIGSRLW